MVRLSGVALVMLGFCQAQAEPRPSPFTGQWSGEVSGCGQFTLAVANILPNGAVVGTVDCPELGLVRAVGDKAISGKQLRGWIEGITLFLEGDHATAHVSIEANALVGFAKVPLSKTVPIVLFRAKR